MPEENSQKKIVLNEQQLLQVFQIENERWRQSMEKANAMKMIQSETINAIETIKAIQDTKEKEKIIVPVGAGVFLTARLENTKEALLSFFGGAGLQKPLKEIQTELEKKLQNVENAIEKETQNTQAITANLENLSFAIRQMEQKARQKNFKGN